MRRTFPRRFAMRAFRKKRCRGWRKKPGRSGRASLIRVISTRLGRLKSTNARIEEGVRSQESGVRMTRWALLLFCFTAFADDWPQFRGNPSLTGIAASPVPKTLKLLWTFEAGESI